MKRLGSVLLGVWLVGLVMVLAQGCKPKSQVIHDHYVGAIGSQSLPTITYSTVEDGGAVAPSGATDGFSISGVTKYRITLCANNGNLAGAGTLQDWLYPTSVAQWTRNPGLDVTVSVTGSPCQSWPDFVAGINAGRAKPVLSGSGTSNDGGTAYTVYVDYVQE